MSRSKSARSMARPSAGRMLLVGFMLLAFAVQGFLLQTHVHPQNYTAAAKADTGTGKHSNYPGSDDPNCPLCKELQYSGQYVTPLWAVFLLPTVAVSVIDAAMLALPRFEAASHSWSSRAPPRR